MANYSAEITYARINSNNTSLANSNDGAGDGSGVSITEVIDAPTLSGFTVSGTPSGTVVIADASVEGTFEAGQYLYYWDASANPILIGQINTISTSTINLVSDILGVGSNMTNRELGVSYSLITSDEQFYIRVKTSKVPSTTTSFILMPNFQNWRTTPSQRNESPIITAQSNIQRYSNIGTPVSISGTQPFVNFKVITMNTFLSSNNGVTFFANWAQFPQYIWLRATVIPSDATSSALLSATMYRFTTNEFMDNAITVTANTANTVLFDAGYNVTRVTASGGSIGGGASTGGGNI
jgi:hypothetical protein